VCVCKELTHDIKEDDIPSLTICHLQLGDLGELMVQIKSEERKKNVPARRPSV
jgi:hypothetical protein